MCAVIISAYIAKYAKSGMEKWIQPKNANRFSTWINLMEKDCNFQLPVFNDTLKKKDGVSMDSIFEFENLNKDYFVTVIGYENGKLGPLRTFK